MIASPARRPHRGTPSTSTRTRRSETTSSEMGRILLHLPRRHDLGIERPNGGGEALDLEALHRGERRHELLAELLDEPGVRLERVERRAEVSGQLRPRVRVV